MRYAMRGAQKNGKSCFWRSGNLHQMHWHMSWVSSYELSQTPIRLKFLRIPFEWEFTAQVIQLLMMRIPE